MLLRLRQFSLPLVSAAALLLGCSSDAASGPSNETTQTGSTGTGANGSGATGSGGGGNTTDTGSGGSQLTGLDEGSSAGTGATCGEAEAVAELTPIYMVFMYDTSGSMGDQEWPEEGIELLNKAYRWDPMKEGMISFFNDPGSTNLYASLEYFPAPGDYETTCSANYASPTVFLTPLNDAQPLIDSLNRKEPAGGTPTLPALRGAVEYALELKRAEPNAYVTVVLVTDGEPAIYLNNEVVEACPAGDSLPNTIEGVAAVARAAYQGNPSIEINVVGVGDKLDGLAAIAQAGGTQLTLISATDPASTSAELKATLQAIQEAKFSCDMDIPAVNEDIDYNKVNVDFVHSDGTKEPFAKAVGCVGGVGWQYDDENAPSMIQICPQTCNAIQNDPTGQIKVQFGCPTRVL